jgi:hypothetical protein
VKRLLLIVGLGLLVSTSAHAAKARFSTSNLCELLLPCLPPAQFANGAFLAKPVIQNVTLSQLQTVCGGGYAALLGDKAKQRQVSLQAAMASGDAADFGILGCTDLNAVSCVVNVPGEVKAELPELYRLVLTHELAHCRGWVHPRY